jgi:hypothetical protein
MNIVLQQYGHGYYNVWEDVSLYQTTGNNDGLQGRYYVHSLIQQSRKDFKQSCHWTYDNLYIIKDIYGGFLEFLKE